MAHMFNKPTIYNDAATKWLMTQSKAALADMVTELLRCGNECCDDEVSAEQAKERFETLLNARKDLKSIRETIRENTGR